MHKAADDNLPDQLAGIVKLHAGIAVASALIPIPGADIAAAAANIWTMYIRINKELDLPFGENVIKSIGAGIATNIASAGAGFLIVGTALKFVPGLGSLGGAAVMGATIYGLTIVSGIIYMKALTKLLHGKNVYEISEADLKYAAAAEMANKSDLKEMLRSAKGEYRPAS